MPWRATLNKRRKQLVREVRAATRRSLKSMNTNMLWNLSLMPANIKDKIFIHLDAFDIRFECVFSQRIRNPEAPTLSIFARIITSISL